MPAAPAPAMIFPAAVPSAEDLVARTLQAIAKQRSTISRDRILREGLANIAEESERLRLKREASRIEVLETLAHVASLKTTTARRKNLLRALERLRTDDVPDDQRQEQIRMLEKALRDLNG